MTETPRRQLTSGPTSPGHLPAHVLSVDELLAEMAALHRARYDALRYGSAAELRTHLTRTAELEAEYLRRFPDREVDPARPRRHASGLPSGVPGTARE